MKTIPMLLISIICRDDTTQDHDTAVPNAAVVRWPESIGAFLVELVQRANTTESQEVMNSAQAAEFLGLNQKTVSEYASRGMIPHQRLGTRLLFSRRALMIWMGSCKCAFTRER